MHSLFLSNTHIFPFSSLLYLAALSMSLTFGSAVSEVQSIVQPGLADLCCFVDRIQTCLVLYPPKILQPKHSTDQRAAWLKETAATATFLFFFSESRNVFPILITINTQTYIQYMHAWSSNTNWYMHTLDTPHTHLPFFWQADRAVQ